MAATVVLVVRVALPVLLMVVAVVVDLVVVADSSRMDQRLSNGRPKRSHTATSDV